MFDFQVCRHALLFCILEFLPVHFFLRQISLSSLYSGGIFSFGSELSQLDLFNRVVLPDEYLSDLNYIHNIDSLGEGYGTVDPALIVEDVSQLQSELLSTVPTAIRARSILTASSTLPIAASSNSSRC